MIALEEHPDVDADDAHQRNWLRKHQVAAAVGAGHSATYGAMGVGSAQRCDAAVVWVDRDWITALAYAYSLDDPLRRLADFYQDPADALGTTAPEIADVLAQATWVHLDKPTPRRTVAAAADLLRSQRNHAVNRQPTSRRPAATSR